MTREKSNDVAARPSSVGISELPVGSGRTLAWLSREFVRGLASVDLSPPQYRVLALMAGGASMGSFLANRLSVSAPSVTALVDALVSRDLVERRHSEDDRRRVTLKLTNAGSELLTLADCVLDVVLSDLASELGDAELIDQAFAGLQLWGEAIAARHASPSSLARPGDRQTSDVGR